MLFKVEVDNGAEIAGYMVGDTFSGHSELIVSRSDGIEVGRITANLVRAEMKAFGRHQTGEVGFHINEAALPGLSGMNDVEIRDAHSGIMIYRRCDPADVIPMKIFRLETQLLPLSRLDRALQPFFQYYFPLIDRHGMETSNQVFLMDSPSIFVSGRVPYKSLEQHIENGYESIALIQDPWDELAERLLVLRLMSQGYNSYLGSRDLVVFEEAIAFAADLPLEDPKEMRRAFRNVSSAVAAALGDPLMRQLTTHLPDEAVQTANVTQALNTLSHFALTGLRRDAGVFIETLADLFRLDPANLPTIEQAPATQALAERLKACRPAEALIENDLTLFGYVRTAFEKPRTTA